MSDPAPSVARTTRTFGKGAILTLLAVAQFMVVLDVSIVNVALPHIDRSLHFASTGDLQWVVNAYTLLFAGFLMLGGRIADEMGRRSVFIAGLAIFSIASLVCGVSVSPGMLIAARAVQGFGAAIVSPAALSIVTTTFAEGKERNTALGVWGAIAGAGGAAGVLLGGILVSQLSWNWIFIINVPIGAASVLLAPIVLVNSRERTGRGFDLVGAVTITGGLLLLVLALVKGSDFGWGSAKTIGLLAGSAVLLAAFIVAEQRAASPLVPLSIFRRRGVSSANVIGLLIGAAIFSMFFFLSLYMQFLLHYSALRTGLLYLTIAVPIIVAAGIGQALVTRLGIAKVLAGGLTLSTLGLLWFSRMPLHSSFSSDMLAGFVLAGLGLGMSFVPVTIAAVSGIRSDQAGVASGLINTSQQAGGALGIAILLSVATSVTGSGRVTPENLLSGYHAAFLVGAIMTAVGVAVTWALLRNVPMDGEAATVSPPRAGQAAAAH
jgi:EmrB/QacA subfamily drug resistance transporter